MAEPTLVQVFGPGATQNATTLTIAKADLATMGLTASATNTPESLLVAIILLGKSYLTDANLDANIEQNISIEDGFASLVTRNSQSYRQQTITVNLQKIDTQSSIDPDDY